MLTYFSDTLRQDSDTFGAQPEVSDTIRQEESTITQIRQNNEDQTVPQA